MGFLSVSTHRGLFQWQGLLLVVSLLTSWNPPTTAKISVQSAFAVDGEDALLRMLNKPPEVVGIVWYKVNPGYQNKVVAFFMLDPSGQHLSGPGNTGVEMIADDGSLILKNVSILDSGMYTAAVHLLDGETDRASALLYVHEGTRGPVLRASRNWVKEDEDYVVLTCYTTGLSIQWLFNDMDLKFTKRMKLSDDGKILTIDSVKREDAGFYKCTSQNYFRRTESKPVELHVLHK